LGQRLPISNYKDFFIGLIGSFTKNYAFGQNTLIYSVDLLLTKFKTVYAKLMIFYEK